MGIEIEAKMRLDDPAKLEGQLITMGAHRGRDVIETNTYFDTHDGSLRTSDQALRIRVEQQTHGDGQSVIITHKGPRTAGDLKRRPETQFQADDAKAIADLFEALGYYAVVRFQKRRRYWELDGCEVVIDSLPHLGHFMEIEGPTDQAVLSLREKLGMDTLPMIPQSYLALLDEYLKAHPDASRDLSFDIPLS